MTFLHCGAIRPPLTEFGEHDNSWRPCLPDHSPEVFDCRLLGSLGSNKLLLGVVASDVVGVDEVRAQDSLDRAQFHSGVVVRKHVPIP